MKKKVIEIPSSQKLCITIEEASDYSGIPVKTIKEMMAQQDCPFRLYPSKKGRKPLIKRKIFEDYILNNKF